MPRSNRRIGSRRTNPKQGRRDDNGEDKRSDQSENRRRQHVNRTSERAECGAGPSVS